MIAATQSNHPMGPVSSPQEPSESVTTLLHEAKNRIRHAQMRITRPRIAIIESLTLHSSPVSIERIHQDIGSEVCDLVTVYRCLSAFEGLGIVRRTYLHNGTCQYELSLGNRKHYHVSCKVCGKSERVDYFSVEGVERMLEERGYTEVSHVVGFYGVCVSCQQVAPSREMAPEHSRIQESVMPEVPN